MLKDKLKNNKNQFESGRMQSIAIERRSEELYKMKDFYRQRKAGTRKLY